MTLNFSYLITTKKKSPAQREPGLGNLIKLSNALVILRSCFPRDNICY